MVTCMWCERDITEEDEHLCYRKALETMEEVALFIDHETETVHVVPVEYEEEDEEDEEGDPVN